MSREPISRQLPLDLKLDPALSRDDLVVTGANAAAVALIDRWPDWPTPVVILAGPAGTGKSHLAQIWSSKVAAWRVDAALIGAQLARHRHDYPYLLDGADHAELDQQGLFHLINTVLQNPGQTLLMTARSFPGAWKVTLPDLASRLKAASIIEINEPDDALLAGVLTKLFTDRQVEVEPTVIQFLVRRMERSLATANAIVARLDRAALERKAPISRVLAAEIITAMDGGQRNLDLGG